MQTYTPKETNFEIKLKGSIFSSVLDVDEPCFSFNAKLKIPYQQFLIFRSFMSASCETKK